MLLCATPPGRGNLRPLDVDDWSRVFECEHHNRPNDERGNRTSPTSVIVYREAMLFQGWPCIWVARRIQSPDDVASAMFGRTRLICNGRLDLDPATGNPLRRSG